MGILKKVTWIAGCAALLCAASVAQADEKVKLEPFVTGINTPLAMVETPDGRFFVVEQWGRVRVVTKDGELLGTPLLDIRNRTVENWSDFDERGLLGITLHPDFANNGKFYVSYSGIINFQEDLAKEFWWDHTNYVSEFTISADDPNLADERSERVISAIDWPQFNHNGHWIGIGPDGMLYMSTGDGGYANDWGIGHNPEHGNGQDLLDIHGKILRIDPATGEAPSDNPFVGDENALPEIWSYGHRNPWRCSFDTATGDLICGDVQQNSYEEVDIIEKGGNYGWRRMEATHCFDYFHPDDHPKSCDKDGLILPILEYPNCTAKRAEGCWGISVTGGYVYHGSHKDWDGKYIYGDWSKNFGAMDGQLFIATKGGDGKWTKEHLVVTGMEGNTPYVLGFAQDSAGEVYALTSITTGPNGSLDTIYKIVPAGM